ncbi:hypothetical protein INO64_13975, partial [Staphylococcus aureus]|nr:hypothetical protein [Staphylococcus aureus]
FLISSLLFAVCLSSCLSFLTTFFFVVLNSVFFSFFSASCCLPNAQIDGKVGRQLVDATPIVKSQYKDYAKKGQKVVVELGTNG